MICSHPLKNYFILEWKWRRKMRSSTTTTIIPRTMTLTKTLSSLQIQVLFMTMITIIGLCTRTHSCSAFQIVQTDNRLSSSLSPILSSSFHCNNQSNNFNYGHDSKTNFFAIRQQRRRRNICTSLYMGKGDGKKKRKKKSATSATAGGAGAGAGATPQQQPQPMRVTNDSLIPVRRQIRWAQMKKEAERNSGTSFRQTNVKRTKYRKSLDEEEIEQAKLERQKRGQDVDWDVILNATASTPLVIVDGYNIIHKYPRLKKWMRKGMLSKARNMLIHDMEELRALKGWRIEIVFDGYGKKNSVNNGAFLGDAAGSSVTRDRVAKSDQEASKKVTYNGVRVVFSGAGMSADAYIESRCFDAKKVTDGKITGSLVIATDDNLIRSAGVSAGAVSMSADRLIDELRALKKSTMHRVEVAVAKANGHSVRPAQLMGKAMPTRGSIIIEDKRNRPKRKKKENGEQSRTLEDLRKGTTSTPSWAIVPPKKDPNNM